MESNLNKESLHAHTCVYVPYSGKFSYGANFRIFRMLAGHTKLKKLRKFEHRISKSFTTFDLLQRQARSTREDDQPLAHFEILHQQRPSRCFGRRGILITIAFAEKYAVFDRIWTQGLLQKGVTNELDYCRRMRTYYSMRAYTKLKIRKFILKRSRPFI